MKHADAEQTTSTDENVATHFTLLLYATQTKRQTCINVCDYTTLLCYE